MNWLLHTTGGLWTRLVVGGAIFLWLAVVDFRRNGRSGTRWREYLFLLTCAAGAMLYGAVNDQITSTISWEYFYYGKELSHVLGPNMPPDPASLHWEAAKVGMKATWTVGLLLGAAMLIANNPSQSRRQLAYRQLLRLLPVVILLAVIFSVIGGLSGARGWLNWASADFGEMWQTNIFRPPHFIAAWGVHLGGYVGGLLGAVIVVLIILRKRAASYAAGGAASTMSSKSGS